MKTFTFNFHKTQNIQMIYNKSLPNQLSFEWLPTLGVKYARFCEKVRLAFLFASLIHFDFFNWETETSKFNASFRRSGSKTFRHHLDITIKKNNRPKTVIVLQKIETARCKKSNEKMRLRDP